MKLVCVYNSSDSSVDTLLSRRLPEGIRARARARARAAVRGAERDKAIGHIKIFCMKTFC